MLKLAQQYKRPIKYSDIKIFLFTAVLIFCTRTFVAFLTPGYIYDENAFTAWALRMAQVPANEFYAEGYFADYPPGYLWILKLIGMIMLWLDIPSGTVLARLLLTFPVILGEVILGCLLVWVAQKYFGKEKSVFGAIVAILNLSLWFNTAVWKQVDALFGLLLVICFLLLVEKRYYSAAFAYGLALCMKPQALILGPALAVVFLLPCLNPATRIRQIKRILIGICISVATVWIPAIPFWGIWESIPKLIEKYITTSSGYPYATINAANLMAALGANWQSWDNKFLFFSWKLWGTGFIIGVTLWIVWLGWKSWEKGGFCPVLLASLYAINIFVLGHAMHERYIVFATILMLFACAKWKDKWLFLYSIAFTGISFVSQVLVYAVVDTPHQFLTEGFAGFFLQILGAVTVVLLVLFSKRSTILMLKEQEPFWFETKQNNPLEKSIQSTKFKNFSNKMRQSVAQQKFNQPPFTKKEVGLLVVATVVLGMVSFLYLGETQAPQTVLDSQQQQTTTFSVQVEQDASEVWIYPGISYGGKLTISQPDGTTILEKELDYATCFQWSSYVLPKTDNTYTITLYNAQLLEMAFKDEQGNVISVNSTQKEVFDEGHLVPKQINQLNSMYFDEIYHARTGYEFLHQLPVYETTHPPLGKDLIALGIAMFGMTAFGWRFFGTLCGVFMMPVLYLLVRRLSANKKIATFAAVLLSLDFMRYSQSRIATIDSYVVLFILLSAYFMVWYFQSVLQKGVTGSILPMALCGIAFGLGVASKWTGLYAGAGLAIVYFAVLYLRYLQKPTHFKKEFAWAIGGGVVFFVIVPFVIYIFSYLPYFIREPDFDLQKWWQCQVTMFEYHSKLQSTHPYQSMWFSWPFNYRPVWYYYQQTNETYASISGMMNPIVCWLSTLAVGYTIVQAVRKKASIHQILLLIFFAAQLLPWVLVTRCTFLYHYFPSMGFAIAMLALAVQQISKGNQKLQDRICIGIVVVAAILFVWFFPAISGFPVGKEWAMSMKWLPSWLLYPI